VLGDGRAEWAEGYEGGIQKKFVNLLTGIEGHGKTTIAGRVIADYTRRGKWVLIYWSAEEPAAKWNRRIALMGGDIDYLLFTNDAQKVWSILNSNDAPDLLYIDALQEFMDCATYYGPKARKIMNRLTAHATANGIPIMAGPHWDVGRKHIMGSKEIHRIARVHLKVERIEDGNHRGRLIRTKTHEVPPNYFLTFRTYKTRPDDINEPAQVVFESMTWQRQVAGNEARALEIAQFARDTTEGKPYPARRLKRQVTDEGSWNYRREITPWLRDHGWKLEMAGQRGHRYWVPPGDYDYSPDTDCWLQKEPDGGWVKLATVLPNEPKPRERFGDVEELMEDSEADKTSQPAKPGEEKKLSPTEKKLAAMPPHIAKLVRAELKYHEGHFNGDRRPDLLLSLFSLPEPELKPIDMDAAQRILDEDHYGLDKIKRRIKEYLAVRKLNPKGPTTILCFVGPPGVGKTSLGESIARAIGREFTRASLGGVHHESEIRGHRHTYVGAVAGKIIESIHRVKARDCVMLLDEIDKMGASVTHGDPGAATLEVLDPEQNKEFTDHYVNIPFDLSKVVFIATANDAQQIPGPLKDRMKVIELKGYTDDEKFEIAKRHLLRRELAATGLQADQAQITDDALRVIISDYAREPGVRNLQRLIGDCLSRVAVQVASGHTGLIRIDAGDLAAILHDDTERRADVTEL
jgi:hypothetical protein